MRADDGYAKKAVFKKLQLGPFAAALRNRRGLEVDQPPIRLEYLVATNI